MPDPTPPNAINPLEEREKLEATIAQKEVELHELKMRLLQTNNAIAAARIEQARGKTG